MGSCLQPIDVIKTLLQLDRTGTYKGVVHCGVTVARTEGVRALWKGLTPFATHLTLKYALRMGSNAVLQSAFKDPETGHISNRGRLLSGFGAGVLEALVIVTPFELGIAIVNDFKSVEGDRAMGLQKEKTFEADQPLLCSKVLDPNIVLNINFNEKLLSNNLLQHLCLRKNGKNDMIVGSIEKTNFAIYILAPKESKRFTDFGRCKVSDILEIVSVFHQFSRDGTNCSDKEVN
ncbi:hypothetical protein RJ639_016600 [Escallonia herrerae]|uniref:Uncharacterized protein n=1 Tax=Escallonia herrerae TaxID=1293975 RepID=A0AA88VCU4_9ASTE|nr:hypothetical protein RJ639_016600 [Escallonia herrerae]